MTGSGLTIKKMERENLLIQVENFTLEISKMISLMEKEFIITRMEMNIEVNGQMTNKMEKESFHGQMKIYMMENLRMA